MRAFLNQGLADIKAKAEATFTRKDEDDQVSPIDISKLEPQEAVAKLKAQNAALAKQLARLAAVKHDQAKMRESLLEAQQQARLLEAELSKKSDILRALQDQHREQVQELQAEYQELEHKMRAQQASALQASALHKENADLRFRLVMAGADSSSASKDASEEWCKLKDSLTVKLQDALDRAARAEAQLVARAPDATTRGAATKGPGPPGRPLSPSRPQARLACTEEALEVSKASVQDLAERLERQQADLEGLRARQSDAGPGAPGRVAEEVEARRCHSHGAAGSAGQSPCDVHAPQEEVRGGDAREWGETTWGDAWGSDEGDDVAQGASAPAVGDTGPEAPARGAMATACGDSSPCAGSLRPEASLVGASEYQTPQASPARGARAATSATRMRPQPQTGPSAHAPSSLSSVTGSPFGAGSIATRRSRRRGQRSHTSPASPPGEPPYCPPFDNPAYESDAERGSPTGSPECGGLLLPRVPDDAPLEELQRHVELLTALTAFLRDRLSPPVGGSAKAADGDGDAVAGGGGRGREALAERATEAAAQLRALCTAIKSAARAEGAVPAAGEDASGPQHQERGVSANGLKTAPSLQSKGSGMGDVPRSIPGSPAISSISGLQSALTRLLDEQRQIVALVEDSVGAAAAGELTKRARLMWQLEAKAREELARLQALTSQQEAEMSFQWNEKQQLQHAAQAELAELRQERAMRQQEVDMLRSQLYDVEAMNEALASECERARSAPRQAGAGAPLPLASVPVYGAQAAGGGQHGQENGVAGLSAEASFGDAFALGSPQQAPASDSGEQAGPPHLQLTASSTPEPPAPAWAGHGWHTPAGARGDAGGEMQEAEERRVGLAEAGEVGAPASASHCRELQDRLSQGAAGRVAEEEAVEVLRDELRAARQCAAGGVSAQEALSREHEALRSSAQGLQAEVDALRERLAACEGGAAGGVQGGAEQVCAELQSRLVEATGRAATLAAAEQELCELRRALEAAQAQLADRDAVVEKLQQGKVELQQALKSVQAQLTVATSDYVSSSNATSEQLVAAKAEVAALQEAVSRAGASVTAAVQAGEDRLASARAEAASAAAQAQQHAAAQQKELSVAKERLERLQKVVKDKKSDLERLQAQHASARAALVAAEARAEALTRELEASRTEATSLSSRLAHAHGDADALAQVCKVVSMAPGVSGADVVGQVKSLAVIAEEHGKLRTEAEGLRGAHERVAALSQEAEALRKAAAADAAAIQRLQDELAAAITDTATSRDALDAAHAELGRVQQQAKKERLRFEAETSRHAVSLSALTKQDPSEWPAAVAALVEERTAAAAAAARDSAGRSADAAALAAEGEVERLRANLGAAEERAAMQEERAEGAAAQCRVLEGELRDQARALQGRISELRAALDAAHAAHARGAAAELERQLEQAQVECAARSAHVEELQAQLAASRAEVGEVQSRLAWLTGSPGPSAGRGAQRSSGAGEIQPAAEPRASAGIEGDAPPADTGEAVEELRAEVSKLRADLIDEQRTHQLRDLAEGARRREIQELQAQQARAGVDVEYVKNVLVGLFESGELPASAAAVTVLGRLLHFTQADHVRLRGHSNRSPAKGSLRFGIFGSSGATPPPAATW